MAGGEKRKRGKKTLTKAQLAFASSPKVIFSTPRATGKVKHTLALLINPTFSLAVAFSEIHKGKSRFRQRNAALSDFSFQMNSKMASPFPKPRKSKQKRKAIYRENKILSHDLYNWAYTLFTAQKPFTKKKTKKLISQNHLSLVFHDFYGLLQNTVT